MTTFTLSLSMGVFTLYLWGVMIPLLLLFSIFWYARRCANISAEIESEGILSTATTHLLCVGLLLLQVNGVAVVLSTIVLHLQSI
jgi:hypothetical protein